MTPDDFESMLAWIQACLIFAAFFTTAFLIVYTFTGWYKYPLGRVVWLQSFAFALAIDLTVVFQYVKTTNLALAFWINVFGFTLIAFSSAALIVMLFKLNRDARLLKKEKEQTNDRVLKLHP